MRKERERRLLEVLLKGIEMQAPITDRESPDFAISTDSRVVGVEVTELYQAPVDGQVPLQAVASISAEIVERAQRAYESTGGQSLRVSVGFSLHAQFQTTRRDNAGQLLLELVQRMLHDAGTNLEWRPMHKEDVRYAELFSRVHIYRQPDNIRPHWLVVSAGWVAPLTADLLQSRIDEKSDRIASYRSAFAEVWLVIGVLGTGPSQFFDFNTDDLRGTFRSPFDRTYFLDGFLGRALLLRTTS